MYKVITLSDSQLNEACMNLLGMIHASGYVFDVVISIAEGGIRVGELLSTPSKSHFSIEVHRPGTKTKKSRLKIIWQKLPQRVNNVIRIIESILLSVFKSQRQKYVIIPEHVEKFITSGQHKILLVDDAIDSGNTMRAVMEALMRINGNNSIKVAALTVTTTSSRQLCDYYLYSNHTLIRFPWSVDYKNKTI